MTIRNTNKGIGYTSVRHLRRKIIRLRESGKYIDEVADIMKISPDDVYSAFWFIEDYEKAEIK